MCCNFSCQVAVIKITWFVNNRRPIFCASVFRHVQRDVLCNTRRTDQTPDNGLLLFLASLLIDKDIKRTPRISISYRALASSSDNLFMFYYLWIRNYALTTIYVRSMVIFNYILRWRDHDEPVFCWYSKTFMRTAEFLTANVHRKFEMSRRRSESRASNIYKSELQLKESWKQSIR